MAELDTAHAVERAVSHLGIGGLVFIAWTTIFCVALLHDDADFVDHHWKEFFWTWLGLAVIWLVIAAVTSWWERRRSSGNTPLPQPPRVPVAEKPTYSLPIDPAADPAKKPRKRF